MSHTVKVKTEFKKFDTLVKAFNKLNWTIKENSKARTYPSDPAKNTIYKYVAVNPQVNGYDVGINVDGENIDLMCDFFGGSVAATLGTQFATLKKEYVLEVTRENFEEVTILEMLADGSLILEADDGY